MASKRLRSPSEEQQDTSSNKKLKIEVPAPKAFCGISDITPQTATHPPQLSQDIITAKPEANNTLATTTAATKQPEDHHNFLWVVLEHYLPSATTQAEGGAGGVPLVKVLGLFTNPTAALEHADEHVRALRTVTTEGICSEPEEEDDRDDDDMSVTSVYERKLEVFRGRYQGEVEGEEMEMEEGDEGLVKTWAVRWGNATEVRVERREVFDSKAGAGYFTPLPILGEDDRD